MKDYTFSITAREADGKLHAYNVTDERRGYRKSWYKTEESARKSLNWWIYWCESNGRTEIQWTLYSKIKGIGIIDTNIKG